MRIWEKRALAALLAGVLALAPATALAADTESESDAPDKTETVTVKADASGQPTEITVEDVLKSSTESEYIQDYSTLTGIKNTEGGEEFTKQADGTILWENEGEDIQYEGKTDKSLPISVSVSYSLDGKAIEPDALAGESGRVRIRFDYENLTEQTDGVQVPFAVISAMLLPSDTFRNISVTNGKLIDMGSQTMVVGYAFPGLSESLDLDSYEGTEEIEIPEYVEVSAEAQDFELAFTATIATTGLLADLDLDDLNDVDDLSDAMGELNDASGELVDGSDQLLTGLQTYQSYMGQYISGVSALESGTSALAEALALLDGNKETLRAGAQALQDGLTTLNGAIPDMSGTAGSLDNSAAEKAISSLVSDVQQLAAALETVQSSLGELKEFAESAKTYSDKVGTDVAAAEEKLDSASAALEEAGSGTVDEDAVKSSVRNAVTSALADKLSNEEIAAVSEAAADSVSIEVTGGGTGTAQEDIKAAKETLDGIGALEVPELDIDTSDIQGIVSDMKGSLSTLAEYAASLNDSSAELAAQLKTLKAAVGQLESGSKQLTSGVSAFNEGVGQVYSGSVQLNTGTAQLVAAGGQLQIGLTTLSEGMSTFAEGVRVFDEEGIDSLSDLAGDDLTELTDRVRALKRADDAYDNFSGIRDGQTGSVRFIIETEEISK